VSTDSGIPDYRGPTGRLRHATPMTYQEFTSSAAARRRYWARSHLGWERIASARPNVTHHVLAELARRGLVAGTVTQNVDGLHTAAGSPEVVDLHGRLDRVVCLDCADVRPRLELGLRLDIANPGFRERAPRSGRVRPDGDVSLDADAERRFVVVDCRACGGRLKPDVVFFGERVPRERFHRALALVDTAGCLLVLGTSLAVGSGYRMVTAAARRGVPVAIVNLGPTRGDRHATLRVDRPLAEVMTRLADGLVADASDRGLQTGPRTVARRR
jgi:NAD-dependent SIR2 family protein deacetylase